ncbi:MAG: hypothetical protein M3Y56_15225, partial [Armatimonadota bacterium]|nr:hypothetical protein [Armatimonadota bacterium]
MDVHIGDRLKKKEKHMEYQQNIMEYQQNIKEQEGSESRPLQAAGLRSPEPQAEREAYSPGDVIPPD